mmetsp:Transcript_40969/g.87280  ORF Transcript_40969/g.87280 Transcript_40969/m.87280 type:complete len:263 (-) Transcript_40969:102-890(-)
MVDDVDDVSLDDMDPSKTERSTSALFAGDAFVLPSMLPPSRSMTDATAAATSWFTPVWSTAMDALEAAFLTVWWVIFMGGFVAFSGCASFCFSRAALICSIVELSSNSDLAAAFAAASAMLLGLSYSALLAKAAEAACELRVAQNCFDDSDDDLVDPLSPEREDRFPPERDSLKSGEATASLLSSEFSLSDLPSLSSDRRSVISGPAPYPASYSTPGPLGCSLRSVKDVRVLLSSKVKSFGRGLMVTFVPVRWFKRRVKFYR